ncbi:hypothetical protein FHW88_004997 [Mucilaginibacter sp. SG538B]|uniref:hypothetical protein n=1 Tax=Mucilaginibacter sp. SG538B TaxID=2587021 RepID=UPI00159D9F28|nr:hypothetical protein [Mucilaginibacter sp. SG538B]NVM66679.1 hypothetical protein [Mucilaginibacter sp. SG538B]
MDNARPESGRRSAVSGITNQHWHSVQPPGVLGYAILASRIASSSLSSLNST